MQYVYIGFLDNVVNRVMNAILKPIVTFLGSLLSKVLSWLFNTVLTPILTSVALPIFRILLDLLKTALSGILYSVMAEILKLVDYMEKAFRIVVGLDPVQVKLDSASVWTRVMGVGSGGDYASLPITEAFFSFTGIHRLYWMLNFIGLALVLLFATIAVARSSFDLDFEGKRPVSRVLSSLFRAMVNLFTLQLVLMFILKLASAILKGIDLATSNMNGGSATSLGRMVFTMASLDACKNPDFNISTPSETIIGMTDQIRRSYYYRECPEGQKFSIYDFTKSKDVELNFDLSKMDFLIGYLIGLFLLIIMGACLIVFVQRLMDMLVLYIASPFFVSTIPLDDGEKFGKWRELFIGKCFSGFGMVMAMQLYVMLCPMIMDSGFRMSQNSLEFDYLCKMLFLIGGAWAILKSGNMITVLLSESAGNTEGHTASIASAMGIRLAKQAVSMAGSAAVGGTKMLFSTGDKDVKDSDPDLFEKDKESESDGKFEGSRANHSTELPGLTKETKQSALSGKAFSGTSFNKKNTQTATKQVQPSEVMIELSDLSNDSKDNKISEQEKDLAVSESSKQSKALQEADLQEKKPLFETKEKPKKRLASSMFGGMIKQYVYRDAHDPYKVVGRGTKVGLGRLFSYEKGPKGKSFKLFGMGLRFQDGAINKVNFGVGTISRMKGSDGKIHVSRINVMGCKIRADKMTGEKKLTDLSPIGLHMTIGKDGHRKLTDLTLIGLHRKLGEDNQYHTTNLMGGIYKHYEAPKKKKGKKN